MSKTVAVTPLVVNISAIKIKKMRFKTLFIEHGLKIYRKIGGLPFLFDNFCGSTKTISKKKYYSLKDNVNLSHISLAGCDFLNCQKWGTQESVVMSNQLMIADCSTGWAINKKLKICSMLNLGLYEQGDINKKIKPNIFRLLTNFIFKCKFLDSAIWLPYGNVNYFHFWNDFLGGLVVLDEMGINHPVLINKNLYKSNFFQVVFLRSDFLRKFKFIAYDPEDIYVVNEIYSANMHWGSLSSFRRTWLAVVGSVYNPSIVRLKVFVSRKKGALRTLKNLTAVESYLSSIGFSVIYFEDISVFEQVKIINETAVICFLHGAGMTNLGFSSQSATRKLIIEITSESFINPVFGYLCNELGYDWIPVTGSKFDEIGEFFLDINSISFLENI